MTFWKKQSSGDREGLVVTRGRALGGGLIRRSLGNDSGAVKPFCVMPLQRTHAIVCVSKPKECAAPRPPNVNLGLQFIEKTQMQILPAPLHLFENH